MRRQRYRRRSSETCSFRDRPVCNRFPRSPTRSTSCRSTNACTSSSGPLTNESSASPLSRMWPSAVFTDSASLALKTPARTRPSTYARLPVTSSSKRRLSKLNDAPNWNAVGSGSPANRPDQRFAIGSRLPRGRLGLFRALILHSARRPLRRGLYRQAPNLDEPFCGGMVELVPLVVGREAVVVEGKRRFSANDTAIAFVELQSHCPRHALLNVRHKCIDRLARGCEPQSVVDDVGILLGEALLEALEILRNHHPFELAMRVVQHH